MAQPQSRFCPRCGTPIVAGQRFCARCGLVTPTKTDDVTQSRPPQQFSSASRQPSAPVWGGNISTSFPSPSRKKRTFGRGGLMLILLLLLVVIGIGSYVVAGLLGLPGPGFGGSKVTTQTPITTTGVNATVTYAGVDLTILNAQQSESFIDDPNTTTTGMVRLNIQEQNKTSIQVSWLYYDTARLILLNKNVVAPTYVKGKVGVAAGSTQTSKVDFAVPSSDKINSLTLRLGTKNEAQIDIPLTGHADLSKYAPKTVKPNGKLSYMGLDWTLISATSQLSIAGQQASKGMVYIVVTLQVDNTLSQQAIVGSAYTYARLKSGKITASPKNTTVPVSFDEGETGKAGTITFLMPQSSTAFTLIFLPLGGAEQVSTDFQFAQPG